MMGIYINISLVQLFLNCLKFVFPIDHDPAGSIKRSFTVRYCTCQDCSESWSTISSAEISTILSDSEKSTTQS